MGVKIQLSPKEWELVADPEWILTKNRILEKVAELLGQHSRWAVNWMETHRTTLPPEAFQHPPKLARGEQYQGLPWLMLDLPRYFDKSHELAIRHFFWWGHFFSSTLQVSGKFKQSLVENAAMLNDETYVCVHTSPWEHHFDTGNYRLVRELDAAEKQEIFRDAGWIKLAKRIPLSEWEQAPAFLEQAFLHWMLLLGNRRV